MTATTSRIAIQPLSSLQHLEAAVALQRDIWGYSDLDTDSRAVLIIASRFIGQVFGAFDGDTLIGMALAFYTGTPGRLHSHRVGVLPQYQNQGIGRELKLAQRADAIERGIQVIQWTFDPLQPRNAYFNLIRLGGIARTYLPNAYGRTSSPLHGGLPTDRLLIEWHLNSPRVIGILGGRNPQPDDSRIEIELPPREVRADPQAQQQLAAAFQSSFACGYAVTSFHTVADRDAYILEKL
jgi:predicted GNAT superfamily acetyltransferase